jgi:hypothetical protein
MTEIEMINEAKTQWLEAKKIISRWDVKSDKDLEVFMTTSIHFFNVYKPYKDKPIFDFDYKRISGVICLENGKVRVSDIVDYWENEDGAIHSFEMEE